MSARGIVLRVGFAYVAPVTGGHWSRARWGNYLLAVAALLAGCSTTSVTLAQETRAPAAESFRLVWSSSAGCGSAGTFLEELANRTNRLRQAVEGEHAITLIVETFRTAGGVRGQLTVRKPDGDLTVREVPGVDCTEVESGMALIAALMVDPLAGSAERARPRPVVPLVAHVPDPPHELPAHRASTFSLRVEQRLTARTAVAPGWTWGQALGVMITHEKSRFRPSAALSAHDAQATVSKPSGSAELRWTAAQLALCPVAAQPDEGWDLRGCASFQLGRLRGVGFHTVRAAQKSIVWTSAGLELAARYRVVGPLWLGLEGAFAFPFSRERFYLEPQETLHQVPAWAFNLGLGVGVRFF